MLSTPILLDYQSSTPCSKDVVDSMKPFWSEIFSNPASKSNLAGINASAISVSYTHLRAHETGAYLVCRLLLEKKKND